MVGTAGYPGAQFAAPKNSEDLGSSRWNDSVAHFAYVGFGINGRHRKSNGMERHYRYPRRTMTFFGHQQQFTLVVETKRASGKTNG